jgi:2-haloacid dehalogenase
VEEPRKFASAKDVAAIVQGYADMEMRPGAAECISRLRSAGFTVWGFTMADWNRVKGYFDKAGIDMPSDNLVSCDSIRIGKPERGAYKPLLDRLIKSDGKPWFAAAHQWDASAARRAGYLGAYCTVWEGEALMDTFGDMDVVAETLVEMADKVIQASG